YPSTIALAASWNKNLAEEFGKSLGRDARARGAHFLLGPAMNIYRVPMDGRNSEYLGEDPYLIGTMAGEIVRGIQSQRVVATLKHFAANNQEDHRGIVSDEVDERTLREIYLRGFHIALETGHPWAVMCAYNKINGEYCSANHWLLTQVLKDDWGFKGLVMSDWGATHDSLGAANAGLDIEMPGWKWFTPDKLMPLIQSGQISMATIDDKVRRILRVEVAMGFGDHPKQKESSIPLNDPKSRAVALKIAEQGIVLLKNENHLLPLDKSKVKTIAVIGPNADPAVTGIGGSSYVDPFDPVSTLAGIRNAVGVGVKVVYIPGDETAHLQQVVKDSVYEADGSSGPGLKAEFFANRELSGQPVLVRHDKVIDFDWDPNSPVPAGLENDNFSVRWTGKIKPAANGTYVFTLNSHAGARLFIDGQKVIDLRENRHTRERRIKRDLVGGQTYDIRIEFSSHWRHCSVWFGWGPPRPLISDEEAKQISHADAAVVCIGFNATLESEGFDRTYSLPNDQGLLVQKVAAINPRTIAVVNAGGNVEMAPWIDSAAGLLQAWYPGEEGGTAIADILFGKVCPSGRLPATFEKRWEDCAAYGNYPGKDDKVYYKEGVFVGYRWFDEKHIEPRFPFGYGLSYTKFELSDLKVKAAKGKQGFDVSARVKNVGDREGADVVQVYVGEDHPTLPTPPRALAGYERVELKAGETKTVRIKLDASSLAHWDPTAKNWTTDKGAYHVWVGESSRDLPLVKGVEWP
ncbi:MAG TPA: glycoside hydrolase family 3 C-terminal domain-containing protein, partial [Tepidisphaeraceae bacterium]|nr:glycoside hydrolase family 3 C-terminal domain-containing protein [Tepidisphaeraceae bacterium]